MPLPLILGIGAAIAGVAGVGGGIRGGVKIKEAKDTMESANRRHQRNQERFERQSETTNKDMDELGETELSILNSFTRFSDVIERIQNRPTFDEYKVNGVEIPKYDREELREVSVGAGVLLGGLGGAALGTAGAFAASGATTAAVMALGTASPGTAIASLSGVAATNATLAALGGGAIAAGGGGIALGSAVLGAATLGVGLLVGGLIFNFTGKGLSDKADEAYPQMLKAEKQIDKICSYLIDLSGTANKYQYSLQHMNNLYQNYLAKLSAVTDRKTDWLLFDDSEKRLTENTVLIVGLLFKMCKVQIVKKAETEGEMNSVNKLEIEGAMSEADRFITDRAIL